MNDAAYWFLWTTAAALSVIVLTAVVVSWWQAFKHRQAERRRWSEFLATLCDHE